MSRQSLSSTWRMVVRSLAVCMLALVGVTLASGPAHAKRECWIVVRGVRIPCPIPVLGGGTGTDPIMPVPPDFLSNAPGSPLPRLQPWIIDLQELFPDQTLLPGDEVTVVVGREIGDDGTAVYVIPVGEDGSATLDLGTLSETDLGGDYSILAVPQAVDSLQEFQDLLRVAEPGMVGFQRFNVENLIALDGDAATVSPDRRQIDILTDVDPSILPNVDVDIQVRREGEPLPQAQNPLMPGIFDTVAPSPEPGAVSLYAPGEYVLQTYAPALAPVVSPYLGAYFTPGEYEVDVTVNGVLESTTTFVIP